jgi:pimeloyl-ACP methyl ester carboxylesterase
MPVQTERPRTGGLLAHDIHGIGVPVVLLHGLTFDRASWRPVVQRLGEDVMSIALDLPGHGMSGGEPVSLDDAAAEVHATLTAIGVDRPIVVGHSMAAAIGMIYAAAHPVRGVVDIDNPVDIRPFAALVQRLEPRLRGDDFNTAFQPFQQSMGLNRLPAPMRDELLARQNVSQDLVLGYWQDVLRTDPTQLQTRIDATTAAIHAPFLAVFGRALAPQDRDHLRGRMPDAEIEEWPDGGHFVHLAQSDRFTDRLRAFVDDCTEAASG